MQKMSADFSAEKIIQPGRKMISLRAVPPSGRIGDGQEIKNIEANIVLQGGTLKDALAQKNLTEEMLRDQIKIQKKVEKLIADKIQVTQEEIDKFISDSKISVPKEKSAEIKKQAGDQLRNQKINQEAQKLISMLKSQAKITYYINL